jgi:uncharacterized YigZ family protein
MLFDDRYKTIEAPVEGIFRDRGSKFIAYAYPIRHEEEVKRYVSLLKSEHPKARHHCWAMRLSPDRSVFRLNDDGEPVGTAGRPILNTILSNDLTNILIVVVRYFGGTLLGVPGLINAYKTAAAEALTAANIIELTVNEHYSVSFDYLQMNDVMKTIKDNGIKIVSQTLENNCCIELEIPKAQLNTILAKLEKIEHLTLKYLRTT